MSLKPKEPWPMPRETGEIGAKILAPDSVYKMVGDELFQLFTETDFADLYPEEGKPGYSPVILSFVSVFQYLEKYPDRQAAEALRMRMDWKYALHLALDYGGFDFSVLSEFRDRLLAHRAEARVFDRIVEALRGKGLIKERGKQRTDSLAMLTKVRHLSRLEMVVESLRLAVSAVLKAERRWGEVVIPPVWEERYGERFVLGRYRPEEWDAYERTVGNDGQWFLERLKSEGAPAELQNLPEVQVLKTVWAQQFRAEAGQMVYQTVKSYDGHTEIQTPHDPQARYSKKRDFAWVGGKLQVTETEDAGYPHLITDIAGTCSNLSDYEALAPIQERLEKRGCLPAEQYVDYGYMSGKNLAASQQIGIDLIGPLQDGHSLQSKLPDGITHEQFSIDWENKHVTCPSGQQSVRQSKFAKNGLSFFFAAETCLGCPLRSRCCTGKGGRTLEVRSSYQLLRQARERQKTEAFLKDYHQHRSGVEGCLSALARGNGLRVSRYTGHPKRHFQALFGGAAANLKRTARWLAGIRFFRHQQSWNLLPKAT
jgi:transposase